MTDRQRLRREVTLQSDGQKKKPEHDGIVLLLLGVTLPVTILVAFICMLDLIDRDGLNRMILPDRKDDVCLIDWDCDAIRMRRETAEREHERHPTIRQVVDRLSGR